MAEGIVQVTEGAGKKLHTWNRTIGANSIEDEFTLPGEFPYATYSVIAGQVSTATANSHLIEIMAGATLPVRIRRISVIQTAAPGAVTLSQLQLFRLTTAGTGGTVVTPQKYDNADAASGATCMTLAAVKGANGAQLWERPFMYGTAAIPPGALSIWNWEQLPNEKPIIIPAGATNGIAIQNPVAVAVATVGITIEFVETNFV